ncbi:MAG: LysM peptidoglycan-binding domain-containing protein, partial [Candidatus Cloacimonetes bacterium]|nr:LysM peptidoglycan-binding domain-containing protein [Candidatus Cloacimonadota bacterium]
KKGDTVGTIARRLGVSQNRIISLNNLKNINGIVIIIPGQKLYY